MKRTSLDSATNSTSGAVHRAKQPIRQQPKGAYLKPDSDPILSDSCSAHDQIALEQSDLKRFKQLPKEVGVMLIAAGIVGLIIPGPGTPALVAGGLALWPGVFGKLESWLEQHHPVVHRRGMKQIGRFLDDLEKRYPYSR